MFGSGARQLAEQEVAGASQETEERMLRAIARSQRLERMLEAQSANALAVAAQMEELTQVLRKRNGHP